MASKRFISRNWPTSAVEGGGVDAWCRRNLPGIAVRRARHKAELARLDYATSQYEAARTSSQRVARTREARAESGVLADGNLPAIQALSEQMYRSDSFYAGLLKLCIGHWLGTGHQIVPKTGDADFDADLLSAWNAYGEQKGGFDVTQRFSFDEMQWLCALSASRGGDCLLNRTDNGYQFFESQQMGTPHGYNRSRRTIVSGVEVSRSGRVKRYWVSGYSKNGYLDHAKARGIREDFCSHYGYFDYFSGYRPIPLLTQAIPDIEQLSGMIEAELFSSRGAASIMATIKSDSRNIFDALSGNRLSGDAKTADKPRTIEVAPAQVVQLFENEEFKLHSVDRPSAAWQQFMRNGGRRAGALIGMPIELSLFDISDANFSTARMLMQICRRVWARFVQTHYNRMLKPVYLSWLDWQTAVKVPEDKAGNFDLYGHEVITPEELWIDEEKRTKGNLFAMKSGEATLTSLAQKIRRPVQRIMKERTQEMIAAKILAAENKEYDLDWRDIAWNFGHWTDEAVAAAGVAGQFSLDSGGATGTEG